MKNYLKFRIFDRGDSRDFDASSLPGGISTSRVRIEQDRSPN